MKEHIIKVNREKCIGCGLCREDCAIRNIDITDSKARILSQNCVMCGHCVAICPKGAISMTGFDEPPMEFDNQTILDPEQLINAIKTRRSIRKFKDTPISKEIIHSIIQAGQYTPTGKNLQDVQYIILQKNIKVYERIAVKLVRKLMPAIRLSVKVARNREIDDDFFFNKAPVAIMILAKDKINGSLAAADMALMAEANGLGVLYSGLFSMAANFFPSLRKALGLKFGQKVVTTLVLGYSNVKYHRTAQKDTPITRNL